MNNKYIPLLLGSALAAAGVIVFAIALRWDGLPMSVSVTNIASLLAPLAFAATVVERGVEILVSPWRDPGAQKLATNLATLKAQAPPDANAVNQAAGALDDFRGATQRYAFAISLVLSTLTAIAGVRAIGPFLDQTAFAKIAQNNPLQHGFFVSLDVALTAALLAGGADGIHSIVNAITTFFDATADKAAKA